MLYHLLYPWHDIFSFLNIFRYITFRTIYASLTSLAICLLAGPWVIRKLKERQIGQNIREEGPQTHFAKKGTPTMGGILILAAILISTLLWADLTNGKIWLALLITLSFGVIGLVDDYKKLIHGSSKGLKGREKLFWQFLLIFLVALILYWSGFESYVSFPFFKNFRPNLGWFYILFVMLVIVGTSNAVNFTDGLDGLAIGHVMMVCATYLIFSYVAGHAKIANYLQIPYVPGVGELAVYCGAIGGACLGFLWFNSYPAQIFMGDVGSLSLGAALGTMAVMTKQEILLLLVGGVFVMETLSVIFQVLSYKLTGKRIFRMAPIHHHFELKGWSEPKVIVRFWIISIIFALLAISTLKLR